MSEHPITAADAAAPSSLSDADLALAAVTISGRLVGMQEAAGKLTHEQAEILLAPMRECAGRLLSRGQSIDSAGAADEATA